MLLIKNYCCSRMENHEPQRFGIIAVGGYTSNGHTSTSEVLDKSLGQLLLYILWHNLL